MIVKHSRSSKARSNPAENNTKQMQTLSLSFTKQPFGSIVRNYEHQHREMLQRMKNHGWCGWTRTDGPRPSHCHWHSNGANLLDSETWCQTKRAVHWPVESVDIPWSHYTALDSRQSNSQPTVQPDVDPKPSFRQTEAQGTTRVSLQRGRNNKHWQWIWPKDHTFSLVCYKMSCWVWNLE